MYFLILNAFLMKYLLVYLLFGFFSLGSSTAADTFQVHCAIYCLGVGAAHLEKCDVIAVTIRTVSG